VTVVVVKTNCSVRRFAVDEWRVSIVEMLDEAHVTPEQAESALGRVQATENDDDFFEALDLDQKEEEMALMGRTINPPVFS
jgi:hypothetical protein